ncbi:MAG: rhomboid family intramembrane serine protease [Lachnospiraceae bacterium]|nr:rhomboid family intramembrane serine protease [Lachnospiraceae bacterium]
MECGLRKRAYVNGMLIVANVLYFLYLEAAGSSEDAYFMYQKGAVVAAAVLEGGEYYRLITAMFMHFGIRHLINNMIVLLALGDNLERALGHVKYLIFYLACGIGANWLSALFTRSDRLVVSAGASGAIFGVVGGLLSATLMNKGQLEELRTRQMIKMIVLSFFMGLTSQGVDHAAHVFGLLFGVVFGAVLYRLSKSKVRQDSEQKNYME